MNIVIDEISCEDHMTIVKGTTAIGPIKGIWKGERTPTLGKTYSVELDIKTLCENNISMFSGRAKQPNVYLKDKMVIFAGQCEDVDGVYFIRFTDDWLEMIDFSGSEPDIKRGDYVLFWQSYDSIWIYPY